MIPLLDEAFYETPVPAARMDALWAQGWRHFGSMFVRYSVSGESGKPRVVQPIRVVLERLQLSKSQRRILRRSACLEVRIQEPRLDEARALLFQAHKRRFKTNVPAALEDFLGPDLRQYPCENVEVAAYQAGRLVAASYLDVGTEGASSVYAMFLPSHARLSPGLCTMLWEMDYARRRGCRYYYPGYAFRERSALDYKKQFQGSEYYDWKGRWWPLKRVVG